MVLELFAKVLGDKGATVIVDMVGDPTAANAAAFMSITFKGSPESKRQWSEDVERLARAEGITLQGAVLTPFRDDLQPDEQVLGFAAIFSRSRAA